MNRRYHLVWISLVCLAAGGVLQTSMKTRTQEDRLAGLNRQITAEQERIRILTAEWHSLKAPDRIETLTRRHLEDLGRITPSQMASLADVPDPLPVPETPTAVAAGIPSAPVTPTRVAERTAQRPATRTTSGSATPVTRAAGATPVRHQAPLRTEQRAPIPTPAASTDEVAGLIARSAETPEGISTIIERSHPQGVLWARFEDTQ